MSTAGDLHTCRLRCWRLMSVLLCMERYSVYCGLDFYCFTQSQTKGEQRRQNFRSALPPVLPWMGVWNSSPGLQDPCQAISINTNLPFHLPHVVSIHEADLELTSQLARQWGCLQAFAPPPSPQVGPWSGVTFYRAVTKPLILSGAARPNEPVWSRRSSACFLYVSPLGTPSFCPVTSLGVREVLASSEQGMSWVQYQKGKKVLHLPWCSIPRAALIIYHAYSHYYSWTVSSSGVSLCRFVVKLLQFISAK